jgi:hypothetical protein
MAVGQSRVIVFTLTYFLFDIYYTQNFLFSFKMKHRKSKKGSG